MFKADLIPSYYEYALMSQYAYLKNPRPTASAVVILSRDYDGPLGLLNAGKAPAQQWKVIDFPYGLHESGYVGCVFFNLARKQIVVAHAGTLPERFPTLRADAIGVVGADADPLLIDSILKVHGDAESFAKKIERGYRLSFTGHSLGGFLAEMSVYACHRGYGVDYSHASAVTFDSPGSLEVMQAWESHINKHKIDLQALNVVSFLSSPNLVNTLHSHPGTVYRLIHDYPAHLNFGSYLLESHSLDKLVALFEPSTGLPRPDAYTEMEDWPLADYDEVFALRDGPFFGGLDFGIKHTLGLLWGLGTGVIARLRGSSKKTTLLTLFGGAEINSLEKLLASEEHYHPHFDTTTARGLSDATRTHYALSTKRSHDHLTITQALSYLHFDAEAYIFLVCYAENKDNPLYQEFLKENGITADVLPEYRVDAAAKEIITLEASVYALRDQVDHLFTKHEDLLATHTEAYQQFIKRKINTLQTQQTELQKTMATLPSVIQTSMQSTINDMKSHIEKLSDELAKLIKMQAEKVAPALPDIYTTTNALAKLPTALVLAGALADKPGSYAFKLDIGLTADEIIKMSESTRGREETYKGVAAAIAMSKGAKAVAITVYPGATPAMIAMAERLSAGKMHGDTSSAGAGAGSGK